MFFLGFSLIGGDKLFFGFFVLVIGLDLLLEFVIWIFRVFELFKGLRLIWFLVFFKFIGKIYFEL